jgi:hypothetical protein
MVTMSQKSSLPQAAKSVSQALTPDNRECAKIIRTLSSNIETDAP